jgi:hypothetical protein
MTTLTDSPEYTANEIYEIQQTDPLEGAATGASFGGIGIDNEPHQQLANRTAFLFGRQNINIAAIQAIANFLAGLTGALSTNASWIQIPYADVNVGQKDLLIQFGFAEGTGVNPGIVEVVWPKQFPTACLAAFCGTYRNVAGAEGTNHVAGFTSQIGEFLFDTISGQSGKIGGWWIAVGW